MTQERTEETEIPGLSFYPVFSFLLFMAALIFPSIISSRRNYLGSTFPFISDTGTLSPASCWFSLFLNFTACSLVITGVIRFAETKNRLATCSKKRKSFGDCLNIFSFLLFCTASFGMCVVAAFQETNSKSIHQSGALVAFTGASLYAIVQSVIWVLVIQEHKTIEDWFAKFIFWSRFLLSILAMTALIIMLAFAPQMGATSPPYKPGEPPYTNKTAYHLAAISEWSLAIMFFFYILSFSYDFWHLKSSVLLNKI